MSFTVTGIVRVRSYENGEFYITGPWRHGGNRREGEMSFRLPVIDPNVFANKPEIGIMKITFELEGDAKLNPTSGNPKYLLAENVQ